MILRRFLGFLAAVGLLGGCSIPGAGDGPPAGLADRARGIPGITGVELAASRPENTGEQIWTSILTLDPALDPAGQQSAITDFYRLVDESGQAGSYRGGEIRFTGEQVFRSTSRLDPASGLLVLLAQLPACDVQYTKVYAITLSARIDGIGALFDQARAFDGLQIPAGLTVNMAVTSAAVPVGAEGYFHFAIGLPSSAIDRALRDELAELLTGAAPNAATIALTEAPIMRITTPQTDDELFAALIDLAARDDRQIRISLHLPGAGKPYQSQTA